MPPRPDDVRAPGEPVDTAGAVSPLVLTGTGLAVGALVTATIVWTPYLVFGYRSPSTHLVLDTVDSCVALLVAYLVYGRFARGGTFQDLLLTQGLVLLAVAGFGLTYAVQALSGVRGGTIDVWLPLTVRVVGSILIAVAAVASAERKVLPTGRRWAVAGPAAVVAGAFVAFFAARSRLPVALDATYFPTSAQHPVLSGHPALLVAQAVAAACFLLASIAFTRKSLRQHDELLRWIGPACALAAFSRLNYMLFPSLYTDWLYAGDVLRTGFYLLLLVGAARELGRYWSARATAAVLEDRRRLARELHDGVLQELAYIRSESRSLPATVTAKDRITSASDRALDEARAAVHALGRSSDEALGFVLHRAAQEVAERFELDLEVDVDGSIQVSQDQQHALTRITREAMTNAARHGDAERVSLRLGRAGRQRSLVIQDDGTGFDVAAALRAGTGYGLVSMRERARALPGSFCLTAERGAGSRVTVTW
jgi:signal transduction histidine kinase